MIRALVLLLALPTARSRADQAHPPLAPLPVASLRRLPPLLRGADLALIESEASGAERQITVITLARATPEAVREVVVHPGRYAEFVRNLSGKEVRPGPNGTIEHSWKVSYQIVSFSGVNRYSFPARGVDEAAAPVEMIDPTGGSHYRWQFLAPEKGGGTIVVLYGYTDVRHSGGFLDRVLRRAATLEHGLALTTQLTLLLALKAEAERHPGAIVELAPPAAAPYEFLLERGLVAFLRRAAASDRLSDISLVERSRAQPAALVEVAAHPERWSSFVPSITRSEPRGAAAVELEQSIPLMSFTTEFGVRASGDGVDLFGLSGDLRGGQLRWDAAQRAGATELVLRAQLRYDRSSTIMRELFKIEPLLEYGVNVALTLVLMRAVRLRAEGR
jgi:hypothetical protein